MPEKIVGKVAQILNARELVINRGAEHGVAIGMRFAILNSRAADIIDPETGESLGSIDIEKTIVKVVRVTDWASVARTFRVYRTGGIANLSEMFGPAREVPETLKTDQTTFREELDEADSYIKIGDSVIQVFKDEFLDS